MNTKRLNTPILAGSRIGLLCGVMLQVVSAATTADPAGGSGQLHREQLAQQEFFPSKWPGKDAEPSVNQGMEPGSQVMMPPGMGPGRQGMMAGPMGPGSQGMMPPGMGPGRQGMMPPGMGPAGQGIMKPGTESGGQSPTGQGMGPGNQGTIGPGLGPRGPGMMAGPMAGSPMAMLGAIGALDLNKEQRSKYDAINQDLNKRMQEITDRMNAESEKLRKLQKEQMSIGRTLNDLRGHMLQANMDAANRAEELLTDEQRQTLVNQGRHFMMPPRGLPSAGTQGPNAE
jgi:hypothetical protein